MVATLPQKVTSWTATEDGYGGHNFGTPSVIDGRWEDRQVEIRDATGSRYITKSVVYLNVDIAIGDYLYEGESTEADPTTLPTAHPVQQFSRIPDLRGVETERKAYL